MPNKNENLKLDELVKQRISNYEPTTILPDWAKMEMLLGIATKAESYTASSLNTPDFSAVSSMLKKLLSSYVLIAFIMLVAGATVLYFILKSPVPNVETNTTEQLLNSDTLVNESVTKQINTVVPVVEKKQEASQTTEADSLEKIKAEKITQELKEKTEAEAKQKLLEAEANKKEAENREREEEKERKLKEEKKKEEKRKADKKEAERKEKEKKEKEKKALEAKKKEQPKESLKKSNNPIGLSNLMRSVNLDSIKKLQEQQQETEKSVNDTIRN